MIEQNYMDYYLLLGIKNPEYYMYDQYIYVLASIFSPTLRQFYQIILTKNKDNVHQWIMQQYISPLLRKELDRSDQKSVIEQWLNLSLTKIINEQFNSVFEVSTYIENFLSARSNNNDNFTSKRLLYKLLNPLDTFFRRLWSSICRFLFFC